MAPIKSIGEQRKEAQGALARIAALEKEFLPPDPKNPKDPGGRVWQIENSMPQVIMAINQGFDTQRNQLSHATEILDAVVDQLGEDVVIAAVNNNRVQKAIQMAKNRQAATESALKQGMIEVEETIRASDPKAYDEKTDRLLADENGVPYEVGSFVAATEFAPDGSELPGSYYCLPMAKVKKEFQPKLVGQKVGYEFDTVQAFDGQGNALTNPKLGDDGQPVMDTEGKPVTVPQMLKRKVVGIYKAVPPKPAVKAAAEPAAEAPAAPVEAPAAAESAPAPEALAPAEDGTEAAPSQG